MNYYNLSRATQGIVRHLRDYLAEKGETSRPSIVFAHDSRHFAREFVTFCAKVATDNGCDVYLFKQARSTPELSFAVRPSGTEPKIKYYLYGHRLPAPGTAFEPGELPAIVETTCASLETLWQWLEAPHSRARTQPGGKRAAFLFPRAAKQRLISESSYQYPRPIEFSNTP